MGTPQHVDFVSITRDVRDERTSDARLEKVDDFMLEEFRQRFEHWRHVDNRFEHLLNYYITVMGGVVAAFGAIYAATAGNNLEQMLFIYIFVAPFLIVYGHFVARRASSAAVMRARQLISLNLIRRYFWERDKSINAYLVRAKTRNGLADVAPILHPNDEFKHLKPDWHDKTVHFIYVVNAFMAFAFFGVCFYYFLGATPMGLSRMRQIIWAVALGLSCAGAFFTYVKSFYNRRKKKFHRTYQ